MKGGILLGLATFGLVLATRCCDPNINGGGSNGSTKNQTWSGSSTDPASGTPTTATSADNLVRVERFGREGYSSCWATCAEIVMYFSRSGQRARQCDQAIKAFNISANERCCDDDNKMLAGENCDRDGYPDFLAWNFKAKGSKTPLDWEAAMKEINDRQPFIFAWREKEPTVASTHMIVVEGYKDDGSEKWLYVVDPAGFQVPADAYEIPYLQYAGEGQYESVTNYFEIKPLAE